MITLCRNIYMINWLIEIFIFLRSKTPNGNKEQFYNSITVINNFEKLNG